MKKPITNSDPITIEYTFASVEQKAAFFSAYMKISAEVNYPIGELLGSPVNPQDLTIELRARLDTLLGIFYFIGAEAERQTQYQRFNFKIIRPNDEELELN